MQNLSGLWQQISKFVLVGGLNTGIHFLVLNVLTRVTDTYNGIGIALITAVAFTVANTNSYFFNKNWTFKDKEREKEVVKFSTFFLVSFVGLVINIAVVFLVTTHITPFIGIGYILQMLGEGTNAIWANVAALIAVCFSLIWNFVGYKFFVFKK